MPVHVTPSVERWAAFSLPTTAVQVKLFEPFVFVLTVGVKYVCAWLNPQMARTLRSTNKKGLFIKVVW